MITALLVTSEMIFYGNDQKVLNVSGYNYHRVYCKDEENLMVDLKKNIRYPAGDFLLKSKDYLFIKLLRFNSVSKIVLNAN